MAPEHKYPAAHNDVYQAVIGIKQHGNKYGGDPQKISFIGDSAGGHLALATTIRLRNIVSWLPQNQILIYPMLDPKGRSQSYKKLGTDYIITAKTLLSGFELYYSDESGIVEPELDLLACDFSGLPSTTIITAEFDPLRDECDQLFSLMLSHGVNAHLDYYSGVIHGFFQLSAISESAKLCIKAIAKQVKIANLN